MVDFYPKSQWLHADGFPLSVQRQNPQRPGPMHTHDYSEVVLITGGRGVHRTGRESWTLVAGDVFVISGVRQHRYLNTEDLSLINVLFDPKMLRIDQWDFTSLPGYYALFTLEPRWRERHQFRSRLHLSSRDLTAAEAIVEQLESELDRRDDGFQFIATVTFLQLIGFLSRHYGASEHPDSQALLRIAETITYLERHHDEPMNLDMLASMAHMSERSFRREFKKAMGTSPIDYLLQIRINKAAELLRQTKRPISDIAFGIGFEDSNYFSRQFRKIMGTSPRQYRRQFA